MLVGLEKAGEFIFMSLGMLTDTSQDLVHRLVETRREVILSLSLSVPSRLFLDRSAILTLSAYLIRHEFMFHWKSFSFDLTIMATPLDNQTAIVADRLGSATIIWCLIMPLIHLLSLISNIICIIIFSSKTFIHKPIAIYFIGLLISDSTTLLIGYTEMIDRETHMIDKSFVLCRFNQKVIHNLTDWMYTFMERFCLEWMLYKVLWTRASTILLAILSIQRTRTFYSLSYRESRLCAVLACIVSLLLAFLITCLEWIGFRCEQSPDPGVYVEIFQNIQKRPLSKEFYSSFLSAHYNESAKSYSCLMRSFDLNQSMYLAGPMINQVRAGSIDGRFLRIIGRLKKVEASTLILTSESLQDAHLGNNEIGTCIVWRENIASNWKSSKTLSLEFRNVWNSTLSEENLRHWRRIHLQSTAIRYLSYELEEDLFRLGRDRAVR